MVVTEPLPVVWCHERYRRAEVVPGGGVLTKLDNQPWIRRLLLHGYVVAVVDARGSGASGGSRPVEFGDQESADAFTVTEWLAEQPWSTGQVGMFGLSTEPVDLVLDLHPTSILFAAGQRLRLSITGCDRDNAETAEVVPAPLVRIHRSARCPSHVVLPVMPPQ